MWLSEQKPDTDVRTQTEIHFITPAYSSDFRPFYKITYFEYFAF